MQISTNNINIQQLSAHLSFGNKIIRETRQLILDLWNKNSFSSELKEDQTPVSEVDLRCEELVRNLIRKTYPAHGIIGEELGTENEKSDFVWTIDPIDGTQNLINRIPTFGTILGLLYKGEPILGWIDHPVINTTLSGGVDVGTFQDGSRVVIKDLPSAELTPNDIIATNCPATFKRGEQEEVLYKILKFHPHSRIYYDVYAHTLAITGSLAVMVEYNLKIWDLSATKALVEGAGGKYQEISKTEKPDSPTLYNAAFGKPKVVDMLVKCLV
jgi:fructose-1,6-bisphosphatase/inositol monophosphatase family enzyme